MRKERLGELVGESRRNVIKPCTSKLLLKTFLNGTHFYTLFHTKRCISLWRDVSTFLLFTTDTTGAVEFSLALRTNI